jgi:two-component system, cell cycle sensor histidine kinase and response regulator CckA
MVLDIHMPGGSGIEVLEGLRADDQRITTIVLTNDPTSQGRAASLRAGADLFFDKSAFEQAVDVIACLALGRDALRASEDRRRELEQHLRQAQRMEAIGQLAGGVAHDFNNLLTVIMGHSEEMITRLPPGDPSRADAVQILNAAEHAATLTRQLLAFSRQQILTPKTLDLNAVVVRLTPLLRRLIGEDVDLAIRVGPERLAVKADPGQLEQMIMNLAVNARDAMPQGGTLTIETANAVVDASHAAERPWMAPGQYARLVVSDTGHGMDAHTKAHLFEAFFTTKAVGQGTGLGLSTVYDIVKQSGGYILVDSEPDQGTAFQLYFPFLPADEIEPASDVPAAHGVKGGTETILLVDDDRGVRGFAHRVLAARGYDVLQASSPDEAQQRCDNHSGPIHLLLTDVVMPGMTGRELADILRARCPGIKVVYMSGYTTEAIRHGVLDPSVTFIAKPFTAESLASTVREALDAPRRPNGT